MSRPPDPRRKRWGVLLKTTERQKRRLLMAALLDQLDRCKDDAARTLLLGIRETM